MSKASKIGFSTESAISRRKSGVSNSSFDPSEFALLANTGIQGTPIFSSREDYDRFEAYLFILNAVESERASNYFLPGREKSVFEASRGEPLVAIGAYSFSPKGFTILARALAPKGVARFMQKIQTAYTMYFNIKYQRSGRLFHARYTSDFARSEPHLKYLFAFVHLFPLHLFDSTWPSETKELNPVDCQRALEYRYSSVGEYIEKKFKIVSPTYFPGFVYKGHVPERVIKMWKDCID